MSGPPAGPTGLEHPFAALPGAAQFLDTALGAHRGEKTSQQELYAQGLYAGAARLFAAAHRLREQDVLDWGDRTYRAR